MVVEELKKIGMALPLIFFIILVSAVSVIIIVSFQETKPTSESVSMTNESNIFADGSLLLGVDTSRGNFKTLDNGTSAITIHNQTNVSISRNNYLAFPNGSIILNEGAKTDLGSGSLINASYQYDIEATSYFYNITQGGGNTLQNISKQMPLLGTIIIIMLIASAALGVFTFIGGRKKPL